MISFLLDKNWVWFNMWSIYYGRFLESNKKVNVFKYVFETGVDFATNM